MEIGEKIKQLRIELGLTQEELADRTELSKGFISQMERDLTSPSIATLEDVLTCLGTDISTFFADEKTPRIVFHDDDYFIKRDEDRKNTIEWIVPNSQKNRMEPIRLVFEKGGKTMPDDPHEGEEFGYVIKGRISLHLGNEEYIVSAGESFYIKTMREHYITSKDGAEIIWVSSPPSF